MNKAPNYELTFTGERALKSHDPISAIRRDTDTVVLKIPRNEGEIKGNEIIRKVDTQWKGI